MAVVIGMDTLLRMTEARGKLLFVLVRGTVGFQQSIAVYAERPTTSRWGPATLQPKKVMIIYTPIARHHTLMITSPKCACQTVEQINKRIFKHPYFITQQAGLPYADKKHDAIRSQNEAFNKTLEDYMSHAVIAVSRNPIKRILSCYNYMILGKHRYTYLRPSGKKWFKDSIEQYTKKHLFKTTFTELVNYTLETPNHLLDIHLAPQTFGVEKLNFTHLVRVENFNNDIQKAADDIGLPLTVPRHIQRNKTNYSHINKDELTTDLIDKIYEIYKDDFKTFNHEKLSAEFLRQYVEKKSFHKGRVHNGGCIVNPNVTPIQ